MEPSNQEQQPVVTQTTTTTSSTPNNGTQQAANNDTVMGILAYIIFFVPLLAGANSPFVRFHTNQGLVLFLFWVAGWVISMFLWFLFFLMPLYFLGILALCIIGIINVTKGEMKPLPLIGGIQILK